MADLSLEFERHRDTAWEATPGRVVICCLARLGEAPMVLTETAAAIWMQLAAPRTVEALAVELAAAYGVEVDQVRGDVETWLAEAVGLGIVSQSAVLPPGNK